MRSVATFSEARDLSHGRAGLVPTMGYLHEGHLSNVMRARDECDTVLVTVFVNPKQFNNPADLDRYPRDVERDLALLADAGTDVVVAPSVDEVYPTDPVTSVSVGSLTEHMEGHFRPGHFDGVALVVAKLLAALQPDRAYFGRKDAQQLAVVERLARDLSFPVEIVPVSTIREADGLALSSRNVLLRDTDRPEALRLSAGLMAAADAAEAGDVAAVRLEGIVRQHLGDLRTDYVQLADAATCQPASRAEPGTFLAVAAHVGAARLIDNVAFDPPPAESSSSSGAGIRADRGTRLASLSVLYGG